ncbi:MAG: hypothetical protein NVSMB57_15580 [Actinomycetota bacterium]
MTPRPYKMDRRAAATEETRTRILEASIMLHSTVGVKAATWQDIAEAAGVSVGTVYYHFPTLDDLVPACSGLALQKRPPPTIEVFQGVRGRRKRIDVLVRTMFEFYEPRAGAFGYTLVERRTVPSLAKLAGELLGHARSLVREALGPDAEDITIAKVEALVDFRVWDSLRERGLTKEVMIATVAQWAYVLSSQS